uniref:SET domain-containing protein n=1 Tax=Tetradesmus obliquus TaxID=3088 RepID=A0A383WBC6_TETOB|eukprot:jgi/Sobl393_1/11346/SZX70189.1
MAGATVGRQPVLLLLLPVVVLFVGSCRALEVQPAHVVAEPLQQGQPAHDAAAAAAASAGALPEELYPTSDMFVGDDSTVDELALLQQLTTQQKLAAVQQLVQWLLANQAEVNVAAAEAGPGAGLGLFAARDVAKGEVLLSLPTDLAFSRKAQGVMDFVLDYALDVADPHSPRALMWATLPHPHELRHLLNFPTAYLPLLQHPQLEDWIGRGLHHDLSMFYRLHADTLAAAGLSYVHLVHVMGLLGTRIFNKPEADGTSSTFYALPLLDMANHDNACPHFNRFEPCAFDSSRECVYFTAGAEVAAGNEVCFYYGHLLPDRALLEYGYLPQQQQQQQQGVLQLSGIDRHDADFESHPLPRLVAEPQPFAGRTAAEVAARIEELQQLSAVLVAGDADAANIAAQGPAQGDEAGAFLQQLLAWRLQRQQAVAAETQRLQTQLLQIS